MPKREYKFKKESLITLNVTLEAKRKITVRMAVDTGATYTLIPWKIIQALGLDPKKTRERIFITTASTTEQAPLINIPIISVSGKKIKNLKAVIHDLPPASRVDGLLGLNVLQALKIKIDFSQNLIKI